MARFHLTILRPTGYRHSDCFFELAESLFHALTALGHTVTLRENWIDPATTTVLFGAHLLTREQIESLPSSVVVYNLEQLGGHTTPAWYMELAARVAIWDYTPRNVARWKQVPCIVPPRLIEPGYTPELSRIASAATQDIDVLFYGAVTERRRFILDALTAHGLRVHIGFGVYGAERDFLIARSKVILNLHAQTQPMFEMVRVSYLLANAKAVVAEESEDAGDLTDAVAMCPYVSLVDVCHRLLQHEQERRDLETRAFALFSARPMTNILLAAGIGARD